jgi:hypothetical protein
VLLGVDGRPPLDNDAACFSAGVLILVLQWLHRQAVTRLCHIVYIQVVSTAPVIAYGIIIMMLLISRAGIGNGSAALAVEATDALNTPSM